MSEATPAQKFATALKESGQLTDSDDALAQLKSLAQGELNFLQAIQMDRALKSLHNIKPDIRLALLSSTTCDHLSAGIVAAGLRHDLVIDVYCGQFGQYRQEVMTKSPDITEFNPDVILFSLHAEDLIPEIPIDTPTAVVTEHIEKSISALSAIWQQAMQNFSCTVIQQTVLDNNAPLFGHYDRLQPANPYQLCLQLNQQLATAAADAKISILDIARRAAQDGTSHWFDRGRWLQAKMEIAPSAIVDYGEQLAQVLSAGMGRSRKCMVLDLDNTLWGGVIGDDGLGGIALGQGSAAGEAHLQLQRYALALKSRGIILAVCSKNDIQQAQAPFKDHPDMLLTLDDISVFVANWKDKAQNLQDISKQLNIGLDSLVFVDDNPAERERIRQVLPMVAVPELAADPALYVENISAGAYFESLGLTQEDQQRSLQYKQNVQRQQAMSTAASMDDYLASLNMSLSYGPITAVHLARATQLIGKTNQFNTTTRRYSREQIELFSQNTNDLTLQVRLKDKFGDNGLVSVILLKPSAAENVLLLHNWVMSCRVFGRQLEQEMMNLLVGQANSRNVKIIEAEFIPTDRNSVIADLFSGLGFARLDQGSSDAQLWQLKVCDYSPTKTHIVSEEIS